MRRSILAALLVIGALLTATVVASAEHSWGEYHWPSDNLSPTVGDGTSSSLYDVSAGVQEWAGLGTGIQPVLSGNSKGDIKVTEAFSPFWLGLARIFLDGGHITKAEVKLNTRLLASMGPDAADHVLCQEIGHVLGLGHNRLELDTCMNDQAALGSATTPNAHDITQLNQIYDGHEDAVADESTGGGGNCPRGNPNHPNCQNVTGRWIIVHVYPIP